MSKDLKPVFPPQEAENVAYVWLRSIRAEFVKWLQEHQLASMPNERKEYEWWEARVRNAWDAYEKARIANGGKASP